jgi:hypothetical protein
MEVAAFKAVVQEGALASRGMPRFGEVGDAEIVSMRLYIRQRAREAISAEAAKTKRKPEPLKGQ